MFQTLGIFLRLPFISFQASKDCWACTVKVILGHSFRCFLCQEQETQWPTLTSFMRTLVSLCKVGEGSNATNQRAIKETPAVRPSSLHTIFIQMSFIHTDLCYSQCGLFTFSIYLVSGEQALNIPVKIFHLIIIIPTISLSFFLDIQCRQETPFWKKPAN